MTIEQGTGTQMNDENFEYVVADKSSPTTWGESNGPRTDLFELQDDFSALPAEGAEATCILHRRIDPWVPLNSSKETNPPDPWEEEPGADEAAAAVRAHIRAAKESDVATLRRLAFGPLLAGMGKLSDAQLLDEVRDVYATEPTVLALGRVYGRTARPGHHHVFTNAALHFDVDDSTGQWLISQVRLLKRADQWGLLTGNWQRLLSTSPSLGESTGFGEGQ